MTARYVGSWKMMMLRSGRNNADGCGCMIRFASPSLNPCRYGTGNCFLGLGRLNDGGAKLGEAATTRS